MFLDWFSIQELEWYNRNVPALTFGFDTYMFLFSFCITEDEPDAFMDHPLMNKKEKTTMYWVSYMDGLQRVLMFTQNPRVARQASQVMSA